MAEHANRIILEITKMHVSCLKPLQTFLGGSGGQCSLHTNPVSNEDIGLHYARGSVEREEASHSTHAYVWMHRLHSGTVKNRGHLNLMDTKCLFLFIVKNQGL